MGFALLRDNLPEYTYNDYCQWEGRWEIIEGVPYSMSPLPTGKHQWICTELLGEFREQLKNCNQCKVSLPMDWKVKETTVIQPDLFVGCFDFKNAKFLSDAPALVVEVLSPATRKKDMNVKYAIYLEQRVKYYVMIDPENNSYTIYQLTGKEYTAAKAGNDGAFRFEFDDCSAVINFGKLW